MNLYRMFEITSRTLWIASLALAYLSVAVGLTGYVDARRVTAVTLGGTAVGLIAAIAYFGVADFKLNRKAPTKRVES